MTLPQKKVPCPTCKKPSAYKDNPYRPFCSQRCKLIDLGQWADGSYRMPGEALSEEEFEQEQKKENPLLDQDS
jgi:endogenous inhibitor of DNA gyrase (YacG/DUF329 family)